MSVISKIETGCYRVPLPVVLSDSTHGDLTHFELILVQIEDAEGSKGVGYTYTVGSGGEAVRVLVEHYLKPLLLGQDPSFIENFGNGCSRDFIKAVSYTHLTLPTICSV